MPYEMEHFTYSLTGEFFSILGSNFVLCQVFNELNIVNDIIDRKPIYFFSIYRFQYPFP